MDSPPPVDQLLARAVDEQLAEQRSWRQAMEGLAERLTRLEEVVAALPAEVAAAVEAAVRTGVAAELEVVGAELRRQVNDLGRLIVNDLGRLPKIIRDAAQGAAPRTE